MERVEFTLLLCSLNRPELLRQCVSSLLTQKGHAFEVVIVDQSDELSVRDWDDRRVRYLHINKKGLSNARNVGLKVARGTRVCLIDDDAVYPKDYLEKVHRAFSETNADIVVGAIFDPKSKEVALRGMKSPRRKAINFYNAMTLCMSPATAFSKTLIDDETFDVELGVGSRWGAGEETDFVWRKLRGHSRALFDPDIRVLHPSNPKRMMSEARAESYSLGFGALFAKHVFVYRDIRAFVLFGYSLARSSIGTLVNIRDKQLRDIHRASFVGKLRGFEEYIRKHRHQSGKERAGGYRFCLGTRKHIIRRKSGFQA